MKSSPAALPRESSLPSTAHAPANTWHRGTGLAVVLRARNSALRVQQGRGFLRRARLNVSSDQALRALMKKMME